MSQASQKRAICILGMHRSGTSVITRCVNLLGISLGNPDRMLPPKFDNPEGFWEHADIVRLHDDILRFFSSSWDTTVGLPKNWWKMRDMDFYKKEICEWIKREFSDTNIWAWKDPRTCLLLPLWIEVLQKEQIELNIIFVIRNPCEVAASLKKRNGFTYSQSYSMWMLYSLNALKHCEGLKCVFVHYDRFLKDPVGQLRKIASKLELSWPQNETDLVINLQSVAKPYLRHSNRRDEDFLNDTSIPIMIRQTYQLLLDLECNPDRFHKEDYKRKIFDLIEAYEFSVWYHNEMKNGKFHVQVFVLCGGGFSESCSFKVASIPDGKFRKIDIPIYGKVKGLIRLDPADIPANIQIEGIKLINPESMVIYKEWSSKNAYVGLRALNNIEDLEVGEVFSFISTSGDSQLLLDGIEVEVENPLVSIDMKVVPLFYLSIPLIEKLLNKIKLQSNIERIIEKIDFLGESLREKGKLEEYFVSELNGKEEQIKRLEGELSEKINRLNILTQQLDNISKELMSAREQNKEKDCIIFHLREQIESKEREIICFKNSRGYKLLERYYRIKDRMLRFLDLPLK